MSRRSGRSLSSGPPQDAGTDDPISVPRRVPATVARLVSDTVVRSKYFEYRAGIFDSFLRANPATPDGAAREFPPALLGKRR